MLRFKPKSSGVLNDLNATQAEIRAGYSAKTAQVNSARLLLNAMVQAEIQRGIKARQERHLLTKIDIQAKIRSP